LDSKNREGWLYATAIGTGGVFTDIASIHEVIPPGALARHRSSPFFPVQVPDLIGVKDRHFLTGIQVIFGFFKVASTYLAK
jgi:hypothetical protein